MYLMKTKYVCEQCGKEFEVYPSRIEHARGEIRFCSKLCYREFQKRRIKLKCVVCGNEYSVIPCRSNSKYCSYECRIKGLTSMERTESWNKNLSLSLSGKERTQEHCENISKSKTGTTYPPRSEEYCNTISKALKGNPKVIASAQRGEKSLWWKGGITPLNHQIRDSLENKNWTLSVFQRDNFQCQTCKHRGGDLEAHHIKPFSKIIEQYNIKTMKDARGCTELWDIDNGITFCKKCHNKKHIIRTII